MKNNFHKSKSMISCLRKKSTHRYLLLLIFCLSFSISYSQVYLSSDDVRSKSSADMNNFTGLTTITFPVNEDGACPSLNIMRWLDIFVVDANNNETLIAKLEKSNLNNCGVAHSTTTNFHCFSFDMCDPLPGSVLSLSNGIGGERIANLTVPNLPDSLSTIKFVGEWDTDWFEVGNNFDIDYSIALINGGRGLSFLPGLSMTMYNLPLEGNSSNCNLGGVIGPIACEHADCPDYDTEINPLLNDPNFFASLRAVSSTKGGPYTSALWLKPTVTMTSYVVDVTYTGKDNLTDLVDHQIIHDGFEQQGTINQEFHIPFTWRPIIGTNVGFIYARVKLLDGNTVVGDYESWYKVFNEGPTSTTASVIDVTQTPIIPRWVIYKPPGDESSSSFNLSTEVCRDLTTTVGSEKTYSTDTDITLGLVVSVGEYATIDIGFGFTGSFGFESGESFSDSESLQTCTKITNGFNTEDLYGNEASDSDLIIGISKKQVVTQADIMYHGSDCKDSIVNQLYIYTVDDGSTQLSAKSRSRLTAERDELMDIVDAYFANPSPTATDTLIALESQNQIDVYNQFFDQIAISEAAALANPSIGVALADPEPGLAWTGEYELSTSNSFSYSYNSVKTTTSGIGGFVTFAGTGFESKQNWEWTETYGAETTENTASVEMIDYVIHDEEDMVIVDIYRNEEFGTPMFRLRPDSRTSCPYEGGILRNKPTLGLPANQSGCDGIAYLSTDASNAIELPLDICNESDEDRDYKIRLKSNTNNAKITIGSELVVDGTTIAFNVPPNDCYADINNNPQLMLIERRANSNITEATIVLEIVPDCFEDDLSDEFNELETSELIINITFNQANTNGDDEECETDRLYVNTTATGNGTGRTWTNAFNFLQDAIAASVSGDTICVAAGEYYPCFGANQPDDETASFSLKNGVVMLGGFAGTESPTFDVNQRDIRSYETVLSGEACLSYHVVYNTNLNNTAVLDGFSITRGVAQNSPTDTNGGGIYNDNSSPVIKNCFINRNQADVGAGIYNINNSNPTITNCNFMKNFAFSTGGAIANAGSVPTISYCSFSGNNAVVNGPAVRVFSSSNVNVSHSIFWGNGSGSGVTNIDILYSAGSGTCDYCIIDADGGGTYPGVGGLNQDPLFVEASPGGPIGFIGGDLRLQANSPAINFLVDPTGPVLDQDGKMRPIGNGHDIGAYEYGALDSDNDGISDLVDLCPDILDVSLNFDGVNDYVLLPNESDFDITGPITVQAWIKVDEFDIPNQGIVTKGNNTWRITRNWINSTIRFSLSGVWEIDGAIEVDDNLWHHIAGVYDGSVMSLYIDGILDVSISRTGSIVTTDDPVTIGSDYLGGSPQRFFDGSIDDVMIWNRALSPLEIQNSMAAPIEVNAPGLVAYYNFNDEFACSSSSQTTAADASPLGNNGTLMNFSLANDCVSNWSSGRNLDSDLDGIGDACDVNDSCPQNFANSNSLSGVINTSITYETAGVLESSQRIISPGNIEYDSAIEINLLADFEVGLGAVFHAYIDGCDNE